MTWRYLFGPMPLCHPQQIPSQDRAEGRCLTFGTQDSDLVLQPDDSWQSLLARCPEGWVPDALVVHLAYQCLPSWAASAPVPLIGLAWDANLLWSHYTLEVLSLCDLVLADTPTCQRLQRVGLNHVLPCCLFGLGQSLADADAAGKNHDWDVLFVGNVHGAVQRERMAWLGRLAKLASRWRVLITSGVFGEEYHHLLRRSRIVFNRGIRGEANLRSFEAAGCGALLFQEEDNQEIRGFFEPGRDCVLYNDDNLEELLTYYLEHEEERARIARSGLERAKDYSFQKLWQLILAEVQLCWPTILERRRQRQEQGLESLSLPARVLETQLSTEKVKPALVQDLSLAVQARPDNTALHNASGVLFLRQQQEQGHFEEALCQQALAHFRTALDSEPDHLVAALNEIEALLLLRQGQAAVFACRRLLARLDRLNLHEELSCGWEAPFWRNGYDLLRVEWERAGWDCAGSRLEEHNEKSKLLRWHLHAVLAELTQDLLHYQEAALLRPDLPATRASLGCALARNKRVDLAVAHLRFAVEQQPLDRHSARALYQALLDNGAREEALQLAEQRRLLHQAAPTLLATETWLPPPRPSPESLVSLVMVCSNQLEYTRSCLESVLQWTRAPYELILVDNGSSDGTAAYLQEVQESSGPQCVFVITNPSNLGFARAANQGWQQAQGSFVVFLHNDVVLTEGWLEGMLAWARHDWPDVAVVGPVTNTSRPPQQIEVTYQDLEQMADFAAMRRKDFARRATLADRLTSFCLLVRRDVLEKVGGLDERYTMGFYDDDLSVKVVQAGYRLLVALNVFVHHVGSRTYAALDLDGRALMLENFQRFHEKWGPQHSVGYRLPGPDSVVPPLANGTRRRQTVGLYVIVKNEEKNLFDCISPVRHLFDAIHVTDTGSTDRTKEIALSLGAQVFDFPWCDSFAAARNASMAQASTDWIFWLDADDRVDSRNVALLQELFANLSEENVGYVLKCVCGPDPNNPNGTVVDHVRLFRNHPRIRWTHRVHEQILPAIRAAGGQIRFTTIAVQHVGYRDRALRKKKVERDLRLLHLELPEMNEHPFTLFNLGSTYLQEMHDPAKALPYLQRSLQKSQVSDSIVRKLYSLIASCQRRLNQPKEALAAYQQGQTHYPDDGELLFGEAGMRLDLGDLDGAIRCYRRLESVQPQAHFASVLEGLYGFVATHHLGIALFRKGLVAEAESCWKKALQGNPRYLLSWRALAELYVQQGRWQELWDAVRALEQLGEDPGQLMRLKQLLPTGWRPALGA